MNCHLSIFATTFQLHLAFRKLPWILESHKPQTERIILIYNHLPGDSLWPLYPLVGGHLTFEKVTKNHPKRVTLNHLVYEIWCVFHLTLPFFNPASSKNGQQKHTRLGHISDPQRVQEFYKHPPRFLTNKENIYIQGNCDPFWPNFWLEAVYHGRWMVGSPMIFSGVQFWVIFWGWTLNWVILFFLSCFNWGYLNPFQFLGDLFEVKQPLYKFYRL